MNYARRTSPFRNDQDNIDSEVANEPNSTANAAVPAEFTGFLSAERFNSNVEINRTQEAASMKVPHILMTAILLSAAVEACSMQAGEASAEKTSFPRVVFISYEDEYHSNETLPRFAKDLSDRFGCRCTVLLGEEKGGIRGLDALCSADTLVLFMRRHSLPRPQMDLIRGHLDAGKPLVALRTASHAFDPKSPTPHGDEVWRGFDHDVLGGNYHDHFPVGRATKILAAAASQSHPILAGVNLENWITPATLYKVMPLAADTTVLLRGEQGMTREPIAWTRIYHGGRVFYTSLGHIDDFANASFRQLLVNAIFWSMDRPVPPKGK